MASDTQGSTSPAGAEQFGSTTGKNVPDGGRYAPRSGAPAPGGDAALRLEKRTYLNSGKWRITLRDFGDGLAEIGWSFVASLRPGKAGKGESADRSEHENRAVRRARSKIRHLILATNADHLLTLTYRENVTDFGRACKDLSKFVRAIKAKHPSWVYIAVPEQQKRGAWHWHMAVHGRQDVEFLRATWRHIVGEGNIDVAPPKGIGKLRTLALVKYLGKYLAKGFAEGNRELNGRRFRASLRIRVPGVSVTLPAANRYNVSGYALDSLKASAGSVGYFWESKDRLAGWACSWS